MSQTDTSMIQRVHELVMTDQIIRSPVYQADQAGRRWGDDLIPALMGLFRIEKDIRDDHHNRWVGFARHWEGETFRLDFDLKSGSNEKDSILVVNAVSGLDGDEIIVDEDYGEIDLPDEVPTEQEWKERIKRYQAARREENTNGYVAVKAFIDALSGWKREIAMKIDEIIEGEIPDVRRAVKWHTPFYGIVDQGWFAQFGVFSKYVKLTFLRGTSLEPEPPVVIKNQEGRALDIKKKDDLDEELITSWVKQAAAIPGMLS